MAATVFTAQENFSTALLTYISEHDTADLKSLCEVITQEGGETASFNRIKKSTGQKGVTSMFVDEESKGKGDDGGDMEEFKATIDYVSSRQKIKKKDMMKTKIDIKNAYVTSLGRAVDRKVDEEIIAAIVSKDAALKKIGSITADYSTEAAVKKLIGAINVSIASAKITPDGKMGVALILNELDWEVLSTSDYVLNQDFAKAFGGASDGMSGFFGAKLCFMDSIASGTQYIMPSNTVGFGEWEASTDATAEYFKTDGMRFHCQAVKSAGAVCIEPKKVTKCSSKPIV